MIKLLNKTTLQISPEVDETNPKEYPKADYNANWLVIPTAIENCPYLKIENGVVVEDTDIKSTNEKLTSYEMFGKVSLDLVSEYGYNMLCRDTDIALLDNQLENAEITQSEYDASCELINNTYKSRLLVIATDRQTAQTNYSNSLIEV